MTPFVHVKFAVFVLLAWTEIVKLTYASNDCGIENAKLEIQQIDVIRILQLTRFHTTNIVEIEVAIASKSKRRSFPIYKWSWASGTGRAILSSIAELIHLGFPRTNLRFTTLTPGIKKVTVFASEIIDGCLPTGSEGYELVFDFLLRQLSHADDTHDYQLCRPYDDKDGLKPHNCCRITTGNRIICYEYFSNLIEHGSRYINVIAPIMAIVGLPIVLRYLRSIPTNHYKINDSPLSFSAIFYTLFIEKQGLVESGLRKFFLWLIIVVVLLASDSTSINIAISVIAFFLLLPFDIFSLNEEYIDSQLNNEYNVYIFVITAPFNFKLWWKILKSRVSIQTSKWDKICYVVLYTFLFPFAFCIVIFYSIVVYIFDVVLYRTICFHALITNCRLHFFKILAFLAALLCTYTFVTFLNLMLTLIAGIYLNGQFFSPYITPIIGIFTYSVKHWRWSVETEYIVLKTNIYKVCKERWEENKPKRERPAEQHGENRPEQDEEHSLVLNGEKLALRFTLDIQDGKLSKAHYNMIRKTILPFDRVLSCFFAKIFFVANYFLIVVVITLLSQESDISGPAQIISTIAVSTVPFMFDTIWVEHTFQQKEANDLEQQQQIRSMVTLVKTTDQGVTLDINAAVEDLVINGLCDVLKTINRKIR